MNRANRNGAGLGRIHTPGTNTVDGVEHLGQNKGRVNRLVGVSAVTTSAGNRDKEGILGRSNITRIDHHLVCFTVTGNMEGDHRIQLVERALFDHTNATRFVLVVAGFFAGLKEKADLAGGTIRHLGEQFRHAKQHGGVRVMATGMHRPGILRRILSTGRLQNRQRIHIGADADDRLAFTQVTNDPGLGHAGLRFNAITFERIRHQPRRALLLKAQLRVGMDIAPPGDQLLMDGFCLF